MRYFWDIYDNHNDCDGDSYGVNSAGHFNDHLALLYYYPAGTGANQINEPWNSALTTVDNLDGRGTASYAANYISHFSSYPGISSTISMLRFDNCYPL